MSENQRSLTEMTDEEIIAEIQALRDRRAQARERRAIEARSPGEHSTRKEKAPTEITGALGQALDDIFNDE